MNLLHAAHGIPHFHSDFWITLLLAIVAALVLNAVLFVRGDK